MIQELFPTDPQMVHKGTPTTVSETQVAISGCPDKINLMLNNHYAKPRIVIYTIG
tara:strand:- start:148 stop:312 length:165 start_codon:yes stop_codon:yes gene_type:complete